MSETVLVYCVDRSWSNVRANLDGELAPSDFTRFHIDRGDTTAKCSRRILLNSLNGDVGELLDKMLRESPGLVCRRCVPGSKR